MTRFIVSTVLWSATLFVAAGRADWARAWIALGLFAAMLSVNFMLVKACNPDLPRERWKRRSNTKPFEKVFAAFFVPSVFAVPVAAGLELRFTGDGAPLWTALAGAALYALGNIPVAAALATNPHLEATVRIQDDRGHRVISAGPYRFVRHPMYVGVILQQIGLALLFESVWALVPVTVIFAALVIRTALEDRTLQAELPGYAEYAQHTRFRLVPLVW